MWVHLCLPVVHLALACLVAAILSCSGSGILAPGWLSRRWPNVSAQTDTWTICS